MVLLIPDSEIGYKIRKKRLKILVTLILLIIAAIEFYLLGFPEWNTYFFIILAIPIVLLLIYYRKD